MVIPTMFPVDKKRLGDKKVLFNNVLIPWYPVSYLKIASSGFFFLGAYGSLPDAAIRVILNYFFLRLAYAWRTFMCAPCEPHVRQAWRRWLSALQLGVLKLAGGVAEWVLRYSGDGAPFEGYRSP